jgi:REP element-mobilizing transposase RayT
MKMTPRVHHRRSIRLKGYDYSQSGAYFVTICTHNRGLLFEEEEVKKILDKEWLNTGRIRQNVILGEFVVMPNHLHGIIMITQGVGAYCDTPYKTDLNYHQKQLVQSFGGLNQQQRDKSICFTKPLEFLFGREITTTTSSAMKMK